MVAILYGFQAFSMGSHIVSFCIILFCFVSLFHNDVLPCFILFFSHFVMVLLGSGKTGKKSPSLFASSFPPELSLVGWGDADWWEI